MHNSVKETRKEKVISVAVVKREDGAMYWRLITETRMVLALFKSTHKNSIWRKFSDAELTDELEAFAVTAEPEDRFTPKPPYLLQLTQDDSGSYYDIVDVREASE